MTDFSSFFPLTASLPQLRTDAVSRAFFVPYGEEPNVESNCTWPSALQTGSALGTGLRVFDPQLQPVSGSPAVWDIYRRQSLLRLLQQIIEVAIPLSVK
jgi:hypothetical protein